MEQYYEMILVDKKKIPLWSRRLHLALKAYQVENCTIINIAYEYLEKLTIICLAF